MINAINEKINKVISSVPFPAFLFVTILIGAILSTSGSAATHVFAATQPTTALPSCTDPTGQNLPCMMVISTLPPPPNAIQCQETSGQTLPCSYATQNLSNGEQVVVITVFVPVNYVFTGYGPWTVVKQVVHETKTTTRTRIVPGPPCPQTQILNPITDKCVDKPICKQPTQHLIFVGGRFVCVPIYPPHICTPLIPCLPCNEAKPGSHVTPIFGCPPPTCDSKYYTGPCPPRDPNALTKCISAALVANDNKGVLGCAKLLPDTPENALTKCISGALEKDDNLAVLKCAKLLPSTNGANTNMTNSTTSAITTPSNISAAIQPTNTSIPTTPSGGKGPGSTCSAGNCTSGTPPPVDCTKNPTDPSCTQTLTPSTTTPTTKTCPDGSVIDASATCPTQPASPNPTNPNTQTPPPNENNPPPSSSDNGGNPSQSSGGGNDNSNSGSSTTKK